MGEAASRNDNRFSVVVVKTLVKDYITSGRTLVSGNSYGKLDLAHLLENKTHLVLALEKSKTCASGCIAKP